MAKITNKSQLNVGTELVLDEANRTFQLLEAGNLVFKDGCSGQALYSKLVDLWNTAAYQDSPFPMYVIDVLSGQFQFGTDGSTFNGWAPADEATRDALRDIGWDEYDASGVLQRRRAGFNGLGSINSGAQPYFILDPADAPTNFTFDDQFNLGVEVYNLSGGLDKQVYAKTFCREYGFKYADSILADTGKTATGAYKVDFLISNEPDLKITDDDATVASTGVYQGITVEYFATDQSLPVGGSNYNFDVVVTSASGASLEEIYTKAQYLLRQDADIDSGAGTVNGKTADILMEFQGETLYTSTGVYINGINPADINRVILTDTGGVERQFPFASAGELTANTPLIGAGSSYRLMFADGPAPTGDEYGFDGAITVQDADGIDIAGTITSGTIPFTFDYDGDTLGGPAGTDKAVVLVGVRPGFGKFTVATGTLTRSKAITIGLVAEADRGYGV